MKHPCCTPDIPQMNPRTKTYKVAETHNINLLSHFKQLQAMIKKGNVAVSLNSGKVGNVRYYTKAGKTYTRVASSDMKNPRSKAQMAVRCRVANIKAMYSNLSVYLKKCFARNWCSRFMSIIKSEKKVKYQKKYH